jgi:ribosomal protein S18 acetylase RimI-like enzyme
MTTIAAAASAEQLEEVRTLMRAFIAWHRDRHREDLDLIDRYFDPVAFEAELTGLPGKYVAPDGRLLLARSDGRPAGCVALRPLDPPSSTRQPSMPVPTCEMKRMYVHSEFRGKGIGRALVEAVVAEARAIGYTTMRLDTSTRQKEAQRLYLGMGFHIIPPYYDLPEDLKGWLVFMERRLS